MAGKYSAKLAPPGEPREGKSVQLVNPGAQAHRAYGLAEDGAARSLRPMVFTVVLLIVGGLFLVGYGVWACVEDRRGVRARGTPRRARHRNTDTSSLNPMDQSSPLFWTTWGASSSGSSPTTSASDAYSGATSDSSSGGSYDCGGSDSSGSSSCDSGGGSSGSD